MPGQPLCPKCRQPLTDYCDWCIECVIRPCGDCGESSGALLVTTCSSCAVKRDKISKHPRVVVAVRSTSDDDDEEFTW